MNILVSVDEGFLRPLKIMLLSMSKSNKDVDVYLLYSSLSEASIAGLDKFCLDSCGGYKLHPINASGFFEGVPLSKQYPKVELYFRLAAAHILPKSVERILYMDADIVVQGSLKELYELDLQGHPIALTSDRYYFCDDVVRTKAKLGLGDEHIYFNTGVILIDTAKYRECFPMKNILDFIEKNKEKIFFFDQDTLNCLAGDNRILIDEKWNYQGYSFEKNTAQEMAEKVVIHFVDLPKPWSEGYKNETLLTIFDSFSKELSQKEE